MPFLRSVRYDGSDTNGLSHVGPDSTAFVVWSFGPTFFGASWPAPAPTAPTDQFSLNGTFSVQIDLNAKGTLSIADGASVDYDLMIDATVVQSITILGPFSDFNGGVVMTYAGPGVVDGVVRLRITTHGVANASVGDGPSEESPYIIGSEFTADAGGGGKARSWVAKAGW